MSFKIIWNKFFKRGQNTSILVEDTIDYYDYI